MAMEVDGLKVEVMDIKREIVLCLKHNSIFIFYTLPWKACPESLHVKGGLQFVACKNNEAAPLISVLHQLVKTLPEEVGHLRVTAKSPRATNVMESSRCGLGPPVPWT